MAPAERYARSRGVFGRRLLLGAPAREQTAGRGGQRGRMLRECARRSRGGGRHAAVRHRKAGESSGAWPYSDNVFIWGLVSRGPRWHKLLRNTAHQFKFCLAGRRDFDGLDALLTRRRVEETQESLVRLDTVFGRLFCDLEGELQGITRTQCDRIRAFCKGNSVQVIVIPFRTEKEEICVAYCSELSWPPSGPETVKRGDRTVS